MLTSFINLETKEVTNEVDKFIVCDTDIAETIALLNKKGYTTNYSCAGHNQNGFLQRTRQEKIEDYDAFMEKYKNNKTVHIIDKNDQYFYHKDDVTFTYTYISFKDMYNFTNLPKGFEIFTNNGGTVIGKKSMFFIDEEKGIRRSDFDIDEELKNTWKNLYEWALSLDYIKRKVILWEK